MLLSLLETGNTIDGVIIANKLLQRYMTNNSLTTHLKDCCTNLNILYDWKERRCHHCMEYIIEAGYSIVCANIALKDNSCKKIYCFNCVILCQEKKGQ